MTSTSGRIPAWRRLGLSLKGDGQSQPAVTESPASRGEPGRDAALDASEHTRHDFQSPVEPALNGKSSRLGKRKHQTDPAEEPDLKPKKNRTQEPDNVTHGTAGHETAPITQSDNAGVDAPAPQDTSTANASQPKGDPNYRKKKVKQPKPRKQDRDAARVAVAPSPSLDEAVGVRHGPTLLASTENVNSDIPPFRTPQKPAKRTTIKDNSNSPSHTERRKSVAFTPDTKTSDGNSGQELFKKWVAEQKSTGAVSAPPPVSDFTLQSLIAEEEKTARRNGQLDKPQKAPTRDEPRSEQPVETKSISTKAESDKTTKTKEETKPAPSKGKKKDPTVYIDYLTQYHSDRENWKFNKAKQNDVVDNALNIFRIPGQHSQALLEYVAGLKGAGVIERLQERCNNSLKELDHQDAKMDDAELRKVAQEEAEQEQIMKERNRRNVDGDLVAFSEHPHSDGYIRRLQRRRAEALLAALARTAPILPVNHKANGINPMMSKLAPQRDSKKRKRRGDVSSDESSSDSSSEDDSSSSDSNSDSDDSDSSDSSSEDDSDHASSNSDSDSDSDSGDDSD